MRILFFAAFAIAADLQLVTETKAEQLSCQYPVRANDTPKSLKARFGKNARMQKIYGAEGTFETGIVLFPNSPSKKLEVIFGGPNKNYVSSVGIRNDENKWTAKSISIGARMKSVVALNKAPLSMQGFDWDYGGYVSDFHKGKLSGDSKCSYGLRFEPPENAPIFDNVEGDRIINSDLKELKIINPRVSEISIIFNH